MSWDIYAEFFATAGGLGGGGLFFFVFFFWDCDWCALFVRFVQFGNADWFGGFFFPTVLVLCFLLTREDAWFEA